MNKTYCSNFFAAFEYPTSRRWKVLSISAIFPCRTRNRFSNFFYWNKKPSNRKTTSGCVLPCFWYYLIANNEKNCKKLSQFKFWFSKLNGTVEAARQFMIKINTITNLCCKMKSEGVVQNVSVYFSTLLFFSARRGLVHWLTDWLTAIKLKIINSFCFISTWD